MTAQLITVKQVMLTRPGESGGLYTDVAWIESRLAVQGRRVMSEDEVVWRVAEVYGTKRAVDLDKERGAWRQFAEALDG